MFASSASIDAQESLNKKIASTYDTQKDIIHYLEINEYLLQFFGQHFIPLFKDEKQKQYRLIVKSFAELETQNS
jgi:hypothetical protein